MDIQNGFGISAAPESRCTARESRYGHGNLVVRALISSSSPVDGQVIGAVTSTTREEYDQVISTAQAFSRMAQLAGSTKR